MPKFKVPSLNGVGWVDDRHIHTCIGLEVNRRFPKKKGGKEEERAH